MALTNLQLKKVIESKFEELNKKINHLTGLIESFRQDFSTTNYIKSVDLGDHTEKKY